MSSMTPGEYFRHGEKNSVGAIYWGPHVKLEILEKCKDTNVGQKSKERIYSPALLCELFMMFSED